jgi:hypothetical protein
MPGFASRVLNEDDGDLRRRLITLYVVPIAGNVLVWIWTFVTLGDR